MPFNIMQAEVQNIPFGCHQSQLRQKQQASEKTNKQTNKQTNGSKGQVNRPDLLNQLKQTSVSSEANKDDQWQ